MNGISPGIDWMSANEMLSCPSAFGKSPTYDTEACENGTVKAKVFDKTVSAERKKITKNNLVFHNQLINWLIKMLVK